jgi:peptide/nickel transport system permease protein
MAEFVPDPQQPGASVVPEAAGFWQRFLEGELWYSFRRSPIAQLAIVLVLVTGFCAVFAPWGAT